MVRRCASCIIQLLLSALCLQGSVSQSNFTEGLYLVKLLRSSTAAACSLDADTNLPTTSTGLHAEFYNAATVNGNMPDTTDLMPFLTRTDKMVNYPSVWAAWTGLFGVSDDFAVRWTGGLVITEAGMYTFFTNSDDGSWLYIDGDLVVDNGGYHAMRTSEGTADLSIGVHQLRMEFFERGGYAGMIFSYSGPDTAGKQLLVPPCALTPAAPGESVASGGLSAEFMLQVVTGRDPTVISSRMFVILVIEQAGNYTFTMSTDVGSSLLLDENSLLEFNGAGGMTVTTATRPLTSGKHAVRMELLGTSSLESTLSFSYSGPDTAELSATVPSCPLLPSLPTAPTVDGVGGLTLELFFSSIRSDALFPMPDLTNAVPDVIRSDRRVNYAEGGSWMAGLVRQDLFAARWSGGIAISSAGSYQFYLDSNDGSRLYIDGALVVNNDGGHGMRLISSTVVLTAGWHALQLEYFQYDRLKGMILSYSGADSGGHTIVVPPCVLSTLTPS